MEFFTPAVIEDLLSTLCMFMFNTYSRSSSNIYEYKNVVWTNLKRIPSIIHVFAAPTFCEAIKQPKGKIVELIVMTVQNTCVGLTAED
jgi:hypothetical protein